MFGPIRRKGVGEVRGLRRHFWYLVFEPTSDASWYSEVHLNRRLRLNSKIRWAQHLPRAQAYGFSATLPGLAPQGHTKRNFREG